MGTEFEREIFELISQDCDPGKVDSFLPKGTLIRPSKHRDCDNSTGGWQLCPQRVRRCHDNRDTGHLQAPVGTLPEASAWNDKPNMEGKERDKKHDSTPAKRLGNNSSPPRDLD